MKTIIKIITIISLILSISTSYASERWVSGHILVKVNDGFPKDQIGNLMQSNGGTFVRTLKGLDISVVNVPHGMENKVIENLIKNPNIKFAEKDSILDLAYVPNDPLYSNQWHIPKIQADSAWDSTKGDGEIIAILDTGVDPTHPDLSRKFDYRV